MLCVYRRTSLARKRTHLGPYRRPVPRVLGGTQVGGRFLMGEIPLYGVPCGTVRSSYPAILGVLKSQFLREINQFSLNVADV